MEKGKQDYTLFLFSLNNSINKFLQLQVELKNYTVVANIPNTERKTVINTDFGTFGYRYTDLLQKGDFVIARLEDVQKYNKGNCCFTARINTNEKGK